MSWTDLGWSDLAFVFKRGSGLARRGLVSLRTRGLRASWQRVLKQFRRVPVARRPVLYLPDAAPFAPFAVPCSDAPRASIVIPVYGQFAHTLACLRALAAHPPAMPVEVIVVDDGSRDETGTALVQVDGLRYHRRATNGGFIAACNDGASLARGEYLVLLNNDTVPQPGWLESLLGTFDEHPDTGIAGAQLVFPDGRLQEAGGVVWHDGSADKLGHHASPDASPFRYVRRVDYVSGAALAIPRSLFDTLGGLDARYAPAYYEDTDLAFRVRATGKHVLVQPASRVVHFEGVTAGTDERQGVKAHQVANRVRFAERWRDVLEAHPPHGTPPAGITDRHHAGVVLVVDALTPRPDRDSGSLRLLNLMRLLRGEGMHVVFLPANLAHDGAYTGALQRLGIECWQRPDVGSVAAWFRSHGPRFSHVVLCRHYVASEFLPLVRAHAPGARLLFDTVDLHYLREGRAAALAGDAGMQRVADKTRDMELEVIRAADLTLVVSDVERELLRTDAPSARVEVLSNLHEVSGPGLPHADRRDLVFVGGFRHPPNVDAVRWFVEEVFPIVRAALPDVRFHCIGDDVPAEIAALSRHDGVQVHGHVPDIAPFMDGARIAVAPLRFGAGVKGKVNLSMAHGQPVVATSCAVEGMHLQPGEDVLVADDPRSFADAVVRLYGDAALWQRLAGNGLRNVSRHFSLEAGREVVRRVLLQR